jgi:succinyl-diaminopimelate desuccinylase
MANKIYKDTGVCTPLWLPVITTIGDPWPMDSPNHFIDRNTPALLGRLKRLVSFATVNPPGRDYEEVTGYLTRELAKVGLSAKRYPIPGKVMRSRLPESQQGFPRYNVIGKLKVPGATKTIHFNAHFDVVPVSGTWRHGSPFSGAVEKGVIFGRGTADMKGSIASLLTALDALGSTRTRPLMNIEVSFTADEETDSYLGARWVVDEAPVRPDYAIVMEGAEGNQVCCGHNGTLWMEVVVHGRAAHGSTPQEGVNALEKMAALVLELETYKTRIARRTFLTPEGKTTAARSTRCRPAPRSRSTAASWRPRTTPRPSGSSAPSWRRRRRGSRDAGSACPRSRRTSPASPVPPTPTSRPWPRA